MSKRRDPSPITIRMLWSRSGGLCAFPGCRVPLLSETPQGKKSLNAHVAHIVAAEDNGPRGDASVDVAARQAYTNLLLLCFKHHEQVDDHFDEFPIASLSAMKETHEAWVAERLEAPDAVDEVARDIYNGIITAALQNLNTRNWATWSMPLTLPYPRIIWNMIEGFNIFTETVYTVAWPKVNPEFEAAAQCLADEIDAIDTLFRQHAFFITEDTFEITRPDVRGLNLTERTAAEEAHDEIALKVAEHITLATKSGNWLADVVRASYDAGFMPTRLHIADDRPVEFDAAERTALVAKYSPA